MLFQGLVATFSPWTSNDAKAEWTLHGGKINEQQQPMTTGYYFCSSAEDPCLKEWSVEQRLIVRHVAWIHHSIREDFLLPLAQYTMDSRFDANAIGYQKFQQKEQMRFQHAHEPIDEDRITTLKRKIDRRSLDGSPSTIPPGVKRQRLTTETPQGSAQQLTLESGPNRSRSDVGIQDLDKLREQHTGFQVKNQKSVRFEDPQTEFISKGSEASESQERKEFASISSKGPDSKKAEASSRPVYGPPKRMTPEGVNSFPIKVKPATQVHSTASVIRRRKVNWKGSNSSAKTSVPLFIDLDHGSEPGLGSDLSGTSGSEEEREEESDDALLSEEEVELALEPSFNGPESDQEMGTGSPGACNLRVRQLSGATRFGDGLTTINVQSNGERRRFYTGGGCELGESITALLIRSTDADAMRIPIEVLLKAGRDHVRGMILQPGVTCQGRKFQFSLLS